MNRYTIYCTPEQIKRALELGAPIYTTTVHWYNHPHEYTYWVEVDIQGNHYAAKKHTAEQMIGWIESLPQIHHISVWRKCVRWAYTFYYVQDGSIERCDIESSGNRKEATLAAIDAALEYLENINNKL